MKDKKGQALVEFAIILPVTLILIFCIIDFGRVIYEKNALEGVASDVVNLYKNDKDSDEIKMIINNQLEDNVDIKFSNRNNYVVIEVSKSIKPITPGFNKISKRVFDIETSRVIYDE